MDDQKIENLKSLADIIRQKKKQEEMRPEDRLAKALKDGLEKLKKESALIAERCSDLARQARQIKSRTPAYSFEAKLKTAEKVKRLKAEFEELREQAIKKAGHSLDDEFKVMIQNHLGIMEKEFDLSEDFGFRPTSGG